MQPGAPAVEREGLEVVLEVRRGVIWRRAREGADLRGRHRERALAEQGVLERHRGAFPRFRIVAVEGASAVEPVDRPQLEVVLQVLADAGQVMNDDEPKSTE